MVLNHQDDGECRGNVVVDIDNKIADFSQSCDLYPGEKAHMETWEGETSFLLSCTVSVSGQGSTVTEEQCDFPRQGGLQGQWQLPFLLY